MEAFTTFQGPAIPIDIANCDTDQIIPARFLRRMRTEQGYGGGRGCKGAQGGDSGNGGPWFGTHPGSGRS